jgi:hypothetical protein
MKKLLLLILSIIPLTSNAEICPQKELNIGGFSYHFDESTNYAKKYGYNETNYTLGLTCKLNGLGMFNDDFEIGVVKNSFNENSFYVAYGIYYPINNSFSIGLRNIVATGYEEAKHNIDGVLGGPLLSMKIKINETLTLNFSGIPSFQNNNKKFDGFIYANLGIKF